MFLLLGGGGLWGMRAEWAWRLIFFFFGGARPLEIFLGEGSVDEFMAYVVIYFLL